MTRMFLIAGLMTAVALPTWANEEPFNYVEDDGAWDESNPAGGSGAQVQLDIDAATPTASVSFETFHEGLASHGEWVTVPNHGKVWRPARVAADWRPYYHGRWEWTDEGWLWVSEEPWGWATYHYGRWSQDPHYGWVWVPGYQWAPAWVAWRYSPDYVGWAPLAPGLSVYVTTHPIHHSWWSFVPSRSFVGVPVHRVALHGPVAHGIFGHTHPAPPRAALFGMHGPAWGGPARPFLERRLGRSIAPHRIHHVASPAAVHGMSRAGMIPIYRPGWQRPTPHRPTVFTGGRFASPSVQAPRTHASPLSHWSDGRGRVQPSYFGNGRQHAAPAPGHFAPSRPQQLPPPASPGSTHHFGSGPSRLAPGAAHVAPSRPHVAPAPISRGPGRQEAAPRPHDQRSAPSGHRAPPGGGRGGNDRGR